MKKETKFCNFSFWERPLLFKRLNLGVTTLSITTFSITTLKKGFFVAPSINDTQYNKTVILLSVIMLGVAFYELLCWMSWCRVLLCCVLCPVSSLKLLINKLECLFLVLDNSLAEWCTLQWPVYLIWKINKFHNIDTKKHFIIGD